MGDNTSKQIGIQVVAIAAAVVVNKFYGPYAAMATYTAIATIGGVLLPPEAEKGNFTPQGLSIQTSQYGIAVPVLYGTRKMAGNLIWYGNFQTHEESSDSGGKGGSQPEQTTITYSVSMAWGLCLSKNNKATVTKAWIGKDRKIIFDTTESGVVESGFDNIIYSDFFNASNHGTDYWTGGTVTITSGDYYVGITYTIALHLDGNIHCNGSMDFSLLTPGTTFDVTLNSDVGFPITIYDGSQTSPDPHIQAMLTAEGKTRFPVWKNLTYVVMENYNLGGSPQIPQFSFEVASEGGGGGGADTLTSVAPMLGTEGYIHSLCVFNNKLYGGTYPNAMLYEWNGTDAWVQKAPKLGTGTSVAITGLVELNGQLYGAGYQGNLLRWNGSDAWVQVAPKLYYGGFQTNLVVFNGEIYAIWADGTGANCGKLMKWNGTDAWIEKSSKITGEYYPHAICVFNGKIYQGGNYNSSKLYEWDGINSWVIVAPSQGTSSIEGLIVFNSKLYGVQLNGRLLEWNGTDAWNIMTGVTGGDVRGGFTVFNNKLYVAAESTPTGIKLYEWNGTDAWILKTFYESDQTYRSNSLCVFNYQLYCGTALQGNLLEFNYQTSYTITDDYPSDISKDILTNTLYGLGLSESYLNLTNFASTKTYCTTNDFLVSFLFNNQTSILDLLGNIISHHNGYISYYDGQISHNQFSENDASVASLNYDSIVKDEPNSPYIQIGSPAERDTYNKIIVEYTKRSDEYVIGTAPADDIVDIDRRGLADNTLKLDGLMTYNRAIKIANLVLVKNMTGIKNYGMKLGVKHLGIIKPGVIAELTDANTETSAQPIRILNVSETSDYRLEIEAMDECAEQYQYTIVGEDSTIPPRPPNLFLPASSVVNPLIVEIPPLYISTGKYGVSFSKPDETQWRGASLYKSYVSGSNYSRIDVANNSGITGTVDALGSLTGDIKYIDITLDTDATLSSATDFDTLLSTPLMNLCVFRTATRDIFLRFEDALLIGTNKWRISNIIYDTVLLPLLNTYGSIAVLDKMLFYSNVPFIESIIDIDVLRMLYFKIPSVNFAGTEQSLADISAITFTNENLINKPLAPYNIKINDIGINSSDSIKVDAGDIIIKWFSRNRFNTGGNNYTRSDAILDDADFYEFQLEIYNGVTLLRTVNQTSKTFTYTSAMQTTDGGYSTYIIKVKQRNNSIDSDYSSSITVNII